MRANVWVTSGLYKVITGISSEVFTLSWILNKRIFPEQHLNVISDTIIIQLTLAVFQHGVFVVEAVDGDEISQAAALADVAAQVAVKLVRQLEEVRHLVPFLKSEKKM